MGRKENRGREHFKEKNRRDSPPQTLHFLTIQGTIHIPDLFSEIPVHTSEITLIIIWPVVKLY